MSTPRLFSPDEYPEGLRCSDCHAVFYEGQVIEDRITGMDTCGELAEVFPTHCAGPEEALFYTEPICTDCALGARV